MAACSDVGALLSGRMGRRKLPNQHANVRRLIAALRHDWAIDEATLEAAVDRLWANIGRTFAEFAVSHRLLRSDRITIEGREIFDGVMASGRPSIAVFAHLGNWELSEMQIGFLIPHRGAVIVDPPASTARAKIAHRVRSRAPAILLPMSRSVWRQGLAQLKKPGGCLMIAIDEKVGPKVMGPGFSGPPDLEGNLGKAARLALATNALILPFYNERVAGSRFVTHMLPAIDPADAAKDDGAVLEVATRISEAMRPAILRNLDQWYMSLFASPE